MINTCVFEGRLTRKNNFKVFRNSRTGRPNPSLLFTIAVQRNFKNQQGNYDSDFINCRASGNTANFLNQYVGIGDTIVASGEMHNDNYHSNRYRDQQGQPATMHSFQFTVFNASLAGRSRKNQMSNNRPPMQHQQNQSMPQQNNQMPMNPMAKPPMNNAPQPPQNNQSVPPNINNNNPQSNTDFNSKISGGNNQNNQKQGRFNTKKKINVSSKDLPF